MSNKEYFLAQKVVTNENDIPIEHIHSFTYIECASMDGNKLVMEIMDQAAVYRDDYGIKRGSEIEVTMADVNERGDQVWIEKFIVAKSTSADGMLTVQAFQKDAHLLKEPVTTPRFFVEMQPKDILAELLPELKIECDSFERGATYHLNAGGTKSRLIRTMARDYGSVASICRGVMHFKSLKNMDMSEQFKLEQSNPEEAEHSIANYSIIGEEALFERVLNRNYASWDTVEGFQGGKRSGAMVMVSVPQAKALNNQHMAIIPILDVELTGNTAFTPLSVCSVLFHKRLPATELDESMPEKQIMNRVAHCQRGNRYQCRIELGVRNL